MQTRPQQKLMNLFRWQEVFLGQKLDRVDLFQRLLSSQGKLRYAPIQSRIGFKCIDEAHL